MAARKRESPRVAPTRGARRLYGFVVYRSRRRLYVNANVKRTRLYGRVVLPPGWLLALPSERLCTRWSQRIRRYGVVLPLEVELVALPSERHLHTLVSANRARRAAVARGLERNERSFAESVGRVDGVTESSTLAVANILAVVVEKEDSARIHDGRRQALTQKLEHL